MLHAPLITIYLQSQCGDLEKMCAFYWSYLVFIDVAFPFLHLLNTYLLRICFDPSGYSLMLARFFFFCPFIHLNQISRPI